MSEVKRKGQVVPKFLVKSIEKKAQHLIVFGCDVDICRSKKTVKALSDGCIFYIPNTKHVLRKKNQVRVKGFLLNGLIIEGFNKEIGEVSYE